MTRKHARAGPSPALNPLLLVAVVLALTADDRNAGKVSDGRQTIGTAVAISETGSLGVAKGAPRAVEREGDAVSRYGIGASLAQLPAAFVAPLAEKRLGPGTSQPLFVLAPLAAVLLAAGAAGGIARLAGAPVAAQAVTVVLAALGSPLGAYATSDFSEALQAAAVGGTLALALASARAEKDGATARRAVAAGFAAGLALLVKSSLAAVSPFLLLPLLAPSVHRWRRIRAAALGATIPVTAWVAFEVVRFGHPFGGYPGEGFTHPLPDGLWRLLVGPNRGLLLFFPAAAFAVVGLARALQRRDEPAIRLAAAAGLTGSLVLLLTSAAWWAWHGVGGWGPRFLVPAVPLLAPWAGSVVGQFGTKARRLVIGASIALNLPPLLVHPSFVDTYVANCRRAALTPAFSRTVPALAVEPDDSGRPSVSPDQALATVPAASPHVLFPWYFAATTAGSPEAVAAKLQRPPWYDRHPELGPRLVPFPPGLASVVAPPPRWNVLGRSFLSGLSDPASGSAYLASLADQVLRAQETTRLDRAVVLAEKLADLWPGETSDALLLESFRLQGRTEMLEVVLRSLPGNRVATPSVLVVMALAARDRGDLSRAARFGSSAAQSFPGSVLLRRAGSPASWPRTYAELTRAEPDSGERSAAEKGRHP